MANETFKSKLARFIVPLLMEKKDGKWSGSLGRISWWIVLAPCLYIWVMSGGVQDIADHHATLLLILAGYNLGKRGIDAFIKKSEESDGPG